MKQKRCAMNFRFLILILKYIKKPIPAYHS